jgi:hypothetical protein
MLPLAVVLLLRRRFLITNLAARFTDGSVHVCKKTSRADKWQPDSPVIDESGHIPSSCCVYAALEAAAA